MFKCLYLYINLRSILESFRYSKMLLLHVSAGIMQIFDDYKNYQMLTLVLSSQLYSMEGQKQTTVLNLLKCVPSNVADITSLKSSTKPYT